MGLSRERKIFAGLLAVAVGALVVDQGLLRPGSASAGQSPGPLEAIVSLTGEGPGAGAGSAGGLSASALAERLRLIAGEQGVAGDAFALPASWMVTEEAPAEAQRAETAPGGEVGSFVVSAVMASGRGVAVINGQATRVGEEVGSTGYRLVQVTSAGAVVASGDRRLTLALPTPEGSR